MMDISQLWIALSKQLATIIGSEQCESYINYLKQLSIDRAHSELSNLLDLNNDYHQKLLVRLDQIGRDDNLRIQNKPENNVNERKTELVEEQNTLIVQGIRMKCTCLGQRHSLVNNCLNCGRIVCAQEGSGSCFTCEEIVCSPHEQIILQANTQKSVALMQQLTSISNAYNTNDMKFQQAMIHKNVLVNQDREFKQTTNKVIDDQNDYFTPKNRWLSQDTRESLEDKEEFDRIEEEQREKPKNILRVDFDENNELNVATTTNSSMPQIADDLVQTNKAYSNPETLNLNQHQHIEDIVGKIIDGDNLFNFPIETSQFHRDLFADPKLELDDFCSEMFGLKTNNQSTKINPLIKLKSDGKFLLPQIFRVQTDDDFYGL